LKWHYLSVESGSKGEEQSGAVGNGMGWEFSPTKAIISRVLFRAGPIYGIEFEIGYDI